MAELKDIAFAVEDDLKYGGSRRLAAILSKKFHKPLYCISKSKKAKVCWNVRVLNKIPLEPIILSITTRKHRKPILLNSKKQIKFMHSLGTIMDFKKKYENLLKQFTWITHRERVYRIAKKLNFDVYLIKDGYIPYDYTNVPNLSLKSKEDSVLSISRISPEKGIEKVVKLAGLTNLPVTIAGYNKNLKYVQKIKRSLNLKNIKLVGTISERVKINMLKKAKIVVNTTAGRCRDYLEYSILDGMLYGCIPLCITPDKKQFEVIEKNSLGIVIKDPKYSGIAIENILKNYGFYSHNCRNFMKSFLGRQKEILKSYGDMLSALAHEN